MLVDDPMQIGAVRGPKGGRKGQKGDGKNGRVGKELLSLGSKKGQAAQAAAHQTPPDGGGGGKKTTTKKKNNAHYGKTRRYCGKMNHATQDCRKFEADLTAGRRHANEEPLHPGRGSKPQAALREGIVARLSGASPSWSAHLMTGAAAPVRAGSAMPMQGAFPEITRYRPTAPAAAENQFLHSVAQPLAVTGGSAKGKAPIPVFVLPVRPLLSMRALLPVPLVLTVRRLLPVFLLSAPVFSTSRTRLQTERA